MLNFTPSFPTHLTLLPSSTIICMAYMYAINIHVCHTDHEGCDQFITAPLCHSFLLTLSPRSNVDPCNGSFLFFKKICSNMGSPWAAVPSEHIHLQCALAWSSPLRCTEYLLWCLSLLHRPWCSKDCFSYFFFLTA